ncbi:hypothetical protein ACSQ67_024487 [Phaseolus vulgaris]
MLISLFPFRARIIHPDKNLGDPKVCRKFSGMAKEKGAEAFSNSKDRLQLFVVGQEEEFTAWAKSKLARLSKARFLLCYNVIKLCQACTSCCAAFLLELKYNFRHLNDESIP